ncbi:peptidase C14 [Auriscalpium vulgare]|uniref:Peptidase C14 n=1 Tax=Auriscalpium vulgare TaxID=40419 RepID=A0ACB8S4R5_9AGAM|nr:peptidase C14 [Auriscalpium vulgare]
MVMTDDSHDQQLLPTRANLISGMHWLLQDAQPHDSLFIHYSGHGARAREASGGDEADGYDEMIFPQDYKHAGTILDDELHKLLVAPLPSGCRLTAVFDSCHSGSVMDLVYNYHSNGKVKRIPVRRSFVEAKTTPGDVMCWSGCDDEETSADAHEGGLAVGAMSYAILKVLRGNPKITYEDLLKGLRRETKKYNQKPQLSASHRMDIDRRFTM